MPNKPAHLLGGASRLWSPKTSSVPFVRGDSFLGLFRARLPQALMLPRPPMLPHAANIRLDCMRKVTRAATRLSMHDPRELHITNLLWDVGHAFGGLSKHLFDLASSLATHRSTSGTIGVSFS